MALFALACNKVEPDDPVYSNPVFKMSGTVDGDSLDYVAGVNSELQTYHYVEFDRSYLGSTFISENGDELLKSEFALEGVLGLTSNLDDAVIGTINKEFELKINDVENGSYASNHVWYVNDLAQEQAAIINGTGTYDIRLELESYGENYVLLDKLILGGEETDEPEIIIEEVQPSLFTFNVSNLPQDLDSVVWKLDNGVHGFLPIDNVLFPAELNPERYVVLCEFYKDGTLLNYKSEMFGSGGLYPIISMDNLLENVSNSAAPNFTKGQMTINHNGIMYSTKDNFSNTEFEVENIEPFTEPVTGEQMIKATISLNTYLFNSYSDSIPLSLNGVIGIQRFPD